MQALLDDSQAVRERVQRCLLCGSCAANCPSGVNVLKIFLKARAILAGYLGLPPPPLKKAIFRRLLAHPRTLKKYQNCFSHILIDEFQDLNSSQYQLVKLLSHAHRNINAVDDDDQSIYRFRGANVEHILNFERDFPGAKVVRLERNYRSTQNILDVSNAVITLNSNRRSKKLWTDRGCGEKVHFCWLDNEAEEATTPATTANSRAR